MQHASAWRKSAGLFFRLLLPESELGRESRWLKLRKESNRLREQKQIFMAEEKLKQAEEVARGFGAEDPRCFQAREELTEFYEAIGSYTQAESMAKALLADREKAFGAEHLETARSLNNLALLHYSQGKNEESEALYRRLMPLLEKLKGVETLEYAVCLENYAALLRRMDRKEESEPMRFQAREIRRQRKQRNEAGNGP